MKKWSWKKILNWGGLGGLALGAALVARKRRKRNREKPVPIPDSADRIEIVTEERHNVLDGKTFISRAHYRLEPTRFRVWSFLRQPEDDQSAQKGQRIYHLTPEVRVFPAEDPENPSIVREERYYATLHLYTEGRRDPLPAHLARGYLVEFRKCHVGGSINGVETGEKVISLAPVAHYEIGESSPQEKASQQS